MGTHRRPQPGTGPLLSKFLFDAVKVAHLAQQPTDQAGSLRERLVELASDVRPAACQRDPGPVRTSVDEGRIRLVPIALDRAAKVIRDDARQAGGPTTGLPVKEDITAGTGVGLQVTLPCAAMTGFQVGDGRLIHLDVATCQHARADRVVHGPQPVGGQSHPACQGLAG